MIYLDTKKNPEKNYIMSNDRYFNLYTSNLIMGKREKDAIWELDHAKLTDDNHLFMSYPERFAISDEVQICFNDKDVVVGRHGYEKWRTEEYERRNADEI